MPDALGYQRREPETTVLYRVVQENLETFLACAREQGRVVPRFVERELRSICPSCGARRMSDTAAHLVNRVFPEVPVRQYVLSLPFPLRTRLAFDQTLCSDVLRIFMQSVFTSLRRRARKKLMATRLHCGSVCFVQRSGGAINLNPHYHALVLDGLYVSSVPYEAPRFHPLPPPTDEEVTRITATIARRVESLLLKKGLLGEQAATDPDHMKTDESLLPQLYSASVQGRFASGPHAGQRLLRLGDRIDTDQVEANCGPRCARVDSPGRSCCAECSQ